MGALIYKRGGLSLNILCMLMFITRRVRFHLVHALTLPIPPPSPPRFFVRGNMHVCIACTVHSVYVQCCKRNSYPCDEVRVYIKWTSAVEHRYKHCFMDVACIRAEHIYTKKPFASSESDFTFLYGNKTMYFLRLEESLWL